MINEDTGFEYLSQETLENLPNYHDNPINPIEDYHEFVEGLPDWDLEPPYELVRRNKL